MKRSLYSILILTLFLFGVTATVSAHDGPHITVRPSDTLSDIAARNNTDIATLRRLNNLGNVDTIHTGGLLALPNAEQPSGSSILDPASLQTDEQIYVVQPGETLSEIARRKGLNLALLLEINQISAAQRLYAGQGLRLPVDQPWNTVDLPAEHIVQPGEHLGTIAAKYGLSAADIASMNRLTDPSLITPGQVLRIGEADLADNLSVNQAATSSSIETTRLQESDLQTDELIETPHVDEKWIDVDLSDQTVVAYENGAAVNSFIISSGLPGTPTVTGEFRIWAKTSIQDMYGGNRAAGNYYYLKDVQWVQYFYEDYAFHGTYWHNNFGQPMSRGCINMRNEDAKWLFEWANPQDTQPGWYFSDASNPGTLVTVHE